MDVVAIASAILVGAGVAALLFKPLFGDLDGFVRCVKFWLIPDIVSLFRGQYHEDWWAEARLGLWLIGAGVSGFLTYLMIMEIFGAQ